MNSFRPSLVRCVPQLAYFFSLIEGIQNKKRWITLELSKKISWYPITFPCIDNLKNLRLSFFKTLRNLTLDAKTWLVFMLSKSLRRKIAKKFERGSEPKSISIFFLLMISFFQANQCPNNFRPTVVPQLDSRPAVLLQVEVLQGDSPLLQLLRYRTWPLDLEITLSIR